MKTREIHLPILMICALLLLLTGTVYGKTGFSIKGFIGNSPTQAAPNTTVELIDGNSGDIIDGVSTNFFGKFKFTGLAPGIYILKVGSVQKKVYVKEKDVRMDIDLSADNGTMDYAGHFIKEQQTASAPKTGAAPSGGQDKPNDTALAAQIAGTWWGYSGSTERKIGLCPDGTYMDYTESSYSGRSFDGGGSETMAWGQASQGGGAGTWAIQGDGQQGTIYVRYNNGSQTSLRYQQCGDPGCLLFNGNKLCRSSAKCN